MRDPVRQTSLCAARQSNPAVRLVLISSAAFLPKALRADAASQHLARELSYLVLIAGAAACIFVLVALQLARALGSIERVRIEGVGE